MSSKKVTFHGTSSEIPVIHPSYQNTGAQEIHDKSADISIIGNTGAHYNSTYNDSNEISRQGAYINIFSGSGGDSATDGTDGGPGGNITISSGAGGGAYFGGSISAIQLLFDAFMPGELLTINSQATGSGTGAILFSYSSTFAGKLYNDAFSIGIQKAGTGYTHQDIITVTGTKTGTQCKILISTNSGDDSIPSSITGGEIIGVSGFTNSTTHTTNEVSGDANSFTVSVSNRHSVTYISGINYTGSSANSYHTNAVYSITNSGNTQFFKLNKDRDNSSDENGGTGGSLYLSAGAGGVGNTGGNGGDLMLSGGGGGMGNTSGQTGQVLVNSCANLVLRAYVDVSTQSGNSQSSTGYFNIPEQSFLKNVLIVIPDAVTIGSSDYITVDLGVSPLDSSTNIINNSTAFNSSNNYDSDDVSSTQSSETSNNGIMITFVSNKSRYLTSSTSFEVKFTVNNSVNFSNSNGTFRVIYEYLRFPSASSV